MRKGMEVFLPYRREMVSKALLNKTEHFGWLNLVLHSNHIQPSSPYPSVCMCVCEPLHITAHWNADHNPKAIVLPPTPESGETHSGELQQMAAWQTRSSMK